LKPRAIPSITGIWSAAIRMLGIPGGIIYDRQYHRIFLHIARIERRYVVVLPLQGRSSWTATMSAAIDLALGQIAPENVDGG
jgi:hypothetical protein